MRPNYLLVAIHLKCLTADVPKSTCATKLNAVCLHARPYFGEQEEIQNRFFFEIFQNCAKQCCAAVVVRPSRFSRQREYWSRSQRKG